MDNYTREAWLLDADIRKEAALLMRVEGLSPWIALQVAKKVVKKRRKRKSSVASQDES